MIQKTSELFGKKVAVVDGYAQDRHLNRFPRIEIDGPLEWNGAREHAKRCVRCRENVPDPDDFDSYQTALRSLRGS